MSGGDPVVAAAAATEFEAQAKAAALRGEGIEAAVATGDPSSSGRASIGPSPRGALVLVARGDLERARAVLEEIGSRQIDWDQVDVGERLDDLPLHPVDRMPGAARIARAVALTVAALTAAGAAAWLVLLCTR